MEEIIEKDKKTILVVDDEQSIMELLVFNLQKEGYNTLEAYDGLTAVDIALKQNNYIKIYLQNGYITVMEMIEKEENEQEVVKFRAMNGRYKNILDLCLALSTQLNEGVKPFPQYKNVKMRNKNRPQS